MSPKYPKDTPSSSVVNYQPISISSVLSKVVGHLVSVHLRRFLERSLEFLTTKFTYGKGLGACVWVPIHIKVH